MSLLMWFAPGGAVARAENPPGEVIDPAVTVDITAQGFAALDAIAGLIPIPPIPIPDPVVDLGATECVDLVFWEPCVSYGLSAGNLIPALSIETLALVPGNGRLDLDLGIEVGVSSASNPGYLRANAGGDLQFWDFDLINEDCDLWLDPTLIELTTRVRLGLATTPQGTDVTLDISNISIDFDLDGFEIDGCSVDFLDEFLTVADDVLNAIGLDLEGTITGLLEPVINSAIQGVLGDLEEQLEDLLNGFALRQEIDLLGNPVVLDIQPRALSITPDGLRIALAGGMDPGEFPNPCVARYVLGGSLDTPGTPPALGAASPLVQDLHLAVGVDDDFVNQVLYAVWYAGVLCFDLSDPDALGIELPITLDTGLLSLLSGGAYDDLFVTKAPLSLKTRPEAPPTATVQGDHDVDVSVRDLGLDLHAVLDGRLTRVAGIDVSVDAGVDLAFNGQTGDLAVLLDLPSDAIRLDVVFNDLRPEASERLGSGLGGIVSTVVGPLLGGLGDSLAFALPSLEGVGVTALAVGAVGPQGEHLGIHGSLGPVAYVGGCEGGGCEGGCSQGSPAGAAWGVGVLLLVARRRRSTVV